MNRKRPYPHFKFPDEIEITIEPLSESDCKWFNCPKGSICLRTTNYGWFPTDCIAGVNKAGRYYDLYEIGLTLSGSMGTASVGVIDVSKAVTLLKEKGYKIKGGL